MGEKISIIIPAYNIADYLGKCLDSVCAQSYRNIEIIVVNDGSTDRTAQIIGEYASIDVRIKPIHKKNGGVTSARLMGVSVATGEYIGFVDGDDYIEPDMFRRLYENMVKYQADISHCGYQMVFPNGRIDYYYDSGLVKVQDNKTGLRDLLEGSLVEPGLWNKLYRKSLFYDLINNEKIELDIKINEDLLMNFYLFRESRQSVYEDICLYHYLLRKNSAATSAVNIHKLQDPIKVIKIILNETRNEEELYYLLKERLIRQLINLVKLTGNVCHDPSIREFIDFEQIELNVMLPEIIQCTVYNSKLKMMAFAACKLPSIYRGIYKLYAKATGIAKKYTVD